MHKACRLNGRGVIERRSRLPLVVLWAAAVLSLAIQRGESTSLTTIQGGRAGSAASSSSQATGVTAPAENGSRVSTSGEASPLGEVCRWAYGVDNSVGLQINNTGPVTATFIDTAVLASQMSTVAGSCTTNFGSCTIDDASSVEWTAML